MAHELLIEQGNAAMMYVGATPWHGLGTKLEKAATAAEAIKAARLDWEVTKIPVYVKGGKRYQVLENKFAVVRCDQKNPVALGIVGKNYQPLQNQAAFGWFDQIVGAGAAIFHTAGALGDGERVWMLAKLPGEIRVKGDDITEKFLLLSNSHDGESSVQVKFTPIRVVCQNTLTMALSSGRTLKISHHRSIAENLREVQINLGILNTRFEQIGKDFKAMAEIKMDGERLGDYLADVFPMPQNEQNEKGKARVILARGKSKELFETGKGNSDPDVRGTLWTAYNGVAEYIDHVSAQKIANRLENMWFSGGYLTKARAFRVAMERVKEWRN